MKLETTVLLAAGLAAAVLSTAGCTTVRKTWADVAYTGHVLTYEEYLSVDQDANPAPTADDVIAQLGAPMSVHDRDGARRRIDYHAFSLTDELKVAEFHFDKNERLVKKELW